MGLEKRLPDDLNIERLKHIIRCTNPNNYGELVQQYALLSKAYAIDRKPSEGKSAFKNAVGNYIDFLKSEANEQETIEKCEALLKNASIIFGRYYHDIFVRANGLIKRYRSRNINELIQRKDKLTKPFGPKTYNIPVK